MMKAINRFETKELERVAYILKAVAHPIRIQIIDLLAQAKRLNVTEIHQLLQVEQSLTSHHLTKMKDRGILSCERKGKSMFYYLTDTKITNIIDCIEKCNM